METKSETLSATPSVDGDDGDGDTLYAVLASLVPVQLCHVVRRCISLVPLSKIRKNNFCRLAFARLCGGIHTFHRQRLFFVKKLCLFAVLLGRLTSKARKIVEPRARHFWTFTRNCGILSYVATEQILLSGRGIWGSHVWIRKTLCLLFGRRRFVSVLLGLCPKQTLPLYQIGDRYDACVFTARACRSAVQGFTDLNVDGAIPVCAVPIFDF